MPNQFDWSILADKDTSIVPRSSHTYDLFNVTVQKCITYGERDTGINLVWGDPTRADSIRFQAAQGSTAPIRFGELLAINVRGGKYLVYQPGRAGVNLGWSDTPKLEWKFLGGTEGDAIESGMIVGLYSMVEKDYLMYESRQNGINLKWFKDSGKYMGAWHAISHSRVLRKVVGQAVTYATGGVVPGDEVVNAAAKALGA